MADKLKSITDIYGNTYKVCVDFLDPEQVENAPDISSLDKKIGDIDTALDEIIEIQDQLIDNGGSMNMFRKITYSEIAPLLTEKNVGKLFKMVSKTYKSSGMDFSFCTPISYYSGYNSQNYKILHGHTRTVFREDADGKKELEVIYYDIMFSTPDNITLNYTAREHSISFKNLSILATKYGLSDNEISDNYYDFYIEN